jgi:hypothetical protein
MHSTPSSKRARYAYAPAIVAGVLLVVTLIGCPIPDLGSIEESVKSNDTLLNAVQVRVDALEERPRFQWTTSRQFVWRFDNETGVACGFLAVPRKGTKELPLWGCTPPLDSQ